MMIMVWLMVQLVTPERNPGHADPLLYCLTNKRQNSGQLDIKPNIARRPDESDTRSKKERETEETPGKRLDVINIDFLKKVFYIITTAFVFYVWRMGRSSRSLPSSEGLSFPSANRRNGFFFSFLFLNLFLLFSPTMSVTRQNKNTQDTAKPKWKKKWTG